MVHHDLGAQLCGGGRRVCNGVGPRPDGAENVLIPGAAGGDDGHVGEFLPDVGDDLRGLGRAGHVEDVRTGGQPAANVHLLRDDGGDDGNVHHLLDLGDRLIGDGDVEHHAEGPLVLRKFGHAHRAVPAGHAASHPHKAGHVGDADDGLGDGGLGREGVDRDDGVRIHVFDDGHVGGEDQGFDPPAEHPDAAALADAVGDGEQMAAQSPLVLWNLFHRHLPFRAARRRA